MSDEEFEKLVLDGIGKIPERFQKKLENVAIIIADEPTPAQRREMHLDSHHTLLGLYQGVPQTRRGSLYYMVLPDKITIFKKPLLAISSNPEVLKQEVADTVWHEIGHHFGLNEPEVRKREQERRQARRGDE
jgi:predicted Zn-dependent protease with MMP-like domain